MANLIQSPPPAKIHPARQFDQTVGRFEARARTRKVRSDDGLELIRVRFGEQETKNLAKQKPEIFYSKLLYTDFRNSLNLISVVTPISPAKRSRY